MIGRIIQNYKIYSVLGEGGMGIVYKAFDSKLERYVALKILNSAAVKQSQFVERFRREAKNQAKLTHPNIVPVYEFTEDQDVMGIAMEFVDGESLEQMITRKGRLELLEALGILQQILVGISYAHNKGFIHRDIKPSNVIINREGVAKIMDFGISKAINEISITKTGAKVGTIMYMSPEQVRAEEPTIQSDIYSIGISFYEMLSGKTPFDYQTEFEILEAHLKKVPEKITLVRNDLPPEVDIVLSKALNKNIHKRYFNCEEFLDDVNKIIRIITSSGTRTKAEKIQPKKRQINWKFYLLVAATIALFVVFGMIGYNVVSGVWDVKLNKNENRDTKLENYSLINSDKKPVVWEALNTKLNFDLNNMYFDDKAGFACGDSGTLITTADFGDNWEIVSIPAYKRNIYDVKFTNTGKGLLVGENGLFLTCDYLGAPWTPKDSAKLFFNTENPPKFKKIIVKNNSIYLIAINGYVYRSKNNGASWEEINKYSDTWFYSSAFTDENSGFVVCDSGLVIKSTDSGNSWNAPKNFTNSNLKDIDFENSQNILTIGSGEVYKTKDGGNSWFPVKYKFPSDISRIKYIGNSQWLIVGNGKIIRSLDSGDNWEQMEISIGTDFKSIFKFNQYVFAAGIGGVILRWKRM